jgi:hypothetical protein
MDVRLKPRRKAREFDEFEATAVLPNVCPECGGSGYLDYINLVRDTKVQKCLDCDLRWESRID